MHDTFQPAALPAHTSSDHLMKGCLNASLPHHSPPRCHPHTPSSQVAAIIKYHFATVAVATTTSVTSKKKIVKTLLIGTNLTLQAIE